MANAELYDKQYKIPSDVLKHIQTVLISNPTANGVKRAKYLLKNGTITYQDMKRLKNFFDYFNPQTDDKIQYALAGGILNNSNGEYDMKTFVNDRLITDRNATKRSKEIKRDMHANVNRELKPYSPSPELNEAKKKLKKNALAVIVNNDNKILLLKRADDSKIWQPNKWGLVGGGIENRETPEQAVKREIKEETGLNINKFIKTFTIQRNPDNIEHIFPCRYNGDPTDIKLNEENSNYGWFDVTEMKFLDIVPNLIDYITIAFKEYK